jgi:pseudaminic acid biosynthesis-associated methylase
MSQLDEWRGEFGKAYTDRNIVEWQKREPAFREMTGGLSLSRVLEIRCNRGHNLVALSNVPGEDTELVGLEPNPYAREFARGNSKIGILNGTTYEIPFKDGYFDLVFTCTVLIHVPLEKLPVAMREISRVSRRYILCIEYFAEQETTIHYRGHDDLLWKRNFLEEYQRHVPGLNLLRTGYWDDKNGFDRSHWWLLEKSRI